MTVLNQKDLAVLKSCIPLNKLSPERFSKLVSGITAENYNSGAQLFEQGDEAKEFIYLISGGVGLYAGEMELEVISAGTDASRFAIAHQIPRRVKGISTSQTRLIRLPTYLLDQGEAEQQSSAYLVEESMDESGDWMATMLQSPIFQRLPAANLQKVLMQMEAVAFEAGGIVVKQGDIADYYYIIEKGDCDIIRQSSDGASPVKLAELHSCDSFGEDALLSGAPRNVTVKMQGKGQLLRLSKDNFIKLVKEPVLQYLDYSQASEKVAQGAAWLDVRSPEAFEENSIAGSINIPFFSLRMKVSSLRHDQQQILICEKGRTSEAAAFLLLRFGFNALILKDGMGGVNKVSAVKSKAGGSSAGNDRSQLGLEPLDAASQVSNLTAELEKLSENEPQQPAELDELRRCVAGYEQQVNSFEQEQASQKAEQQVLLNEQAKQFDEAKKKYLAVRTQLQKNMAEKQQFIEETAADRVQLEQQRDKSKADSQRLVSENELLQQELSGLREAVASLELNNEQLGTSATKLLDEQSAQAKQELEQVRKDLCLAADAQRLSDKELRDCLEQTVADLKSELSLAQQKTIKQADEGAKQQLLFSREQADLLAKATLQDEQIKDLNGGLAQALQKLTAAEQQKAELSDKVGQLEGSVTAVNKVLSEKSDQAEKQLEQANRDLVGDKEQAEALEKELSKLKDEVKLAHEQASAYQQERLTLESELNEKISKLEGVALESEQALNEKSEQAKQEREGLKQELGVATAEVVAHKEQAESLEQAVSGLQNEVKLAQEQALKLVSDSQQEGVTLESELNEKISKLEGAVLEREKELSEKSEQAKQEREGLKQELGVATAEVVTHKELAESLEKTVGELKNEVNLAQQQTLKTTTDSQQERLTLESELNEKISGLEGLVLESQKALSQKDEQAEQQLERIKQELVYATEEVVTHKEQAKSLEQVMGELKNEVSLAQEKALKQGSDSQQEQDSLESELNKKISSLEELLLDAEKALSEKEEKARQQLEELNKKLEVVAIETLSHKELTAGLELTVNGLQSEIKLAHEQALKKASDYQQDQLSLAGEQSGLLAEKKQQADQIKELADSLAKLSDELAKAMQKTKESELLESHLNEKISQLEGAVLANSNAEGIIANDLERTLSAVDIEVATGSVSSSELVAQLSRFLQAKVATIETLEVDFKLLKEQGGLLENDKSKLKAELLEADGKLAESFERQQNLQAELVEAKAFSDQASVDKANVEQGQAQQVQQNLELVKAVELAQQDSLAEKQALDKKLEELSEFQGVALRLEEERDKLRLSLSSSEAAQVSLQQDIAGINESYREKEEQLTAALEAGDKSRSEGAKALTVLQAELLDALASKQDAKACLDDIRADLQLADAAKEQAMESEGGFERKHDELALSLEQLMQEKADLEAKAGRMAGELLNVRAENKTLLDKEPIQGAAPVKEGVQLKELQAVQAELVLVRGQTEADVLAMKEELDKSHKVNLLLQKKLLAKQAGAEKTELATEKKKWWK